MGKSKNPSAKEIPSLKQNILLLQNQLDHSAGTGLFIDDLRTEEDFCAYLELLRKFSMRYTILICSYDTPFGPGYSKELSKTIMKLELKTDLFGRFRAAYAAIIDCGKIIFEEISDGSVVKYSDTIGGCDVQLVSTGYNANDWLSCIKINGKNHFAKSRGINFTVFDKVTGFVLDEVGFDTYSEGIPCSRPSETAEFVRRIKKERSAEVVICKFPEFPSANLTINEKMLLANPNMSTALCNYYTPEEIETVARVIPASYYDVNGVRRFYDYHTALLNTVGGHRFTANQPKAHKKTIYMVGGCRMYGIGSDDSHTVESYLQELFNVKLPHEEVVVQNYGFMFEGLKKNEIPSIIEALPLRPGDLILTELNVGDPEDTPDISRIDISNAFNIPRQCEVVYDTIHYTPDGNRITAESLFANIVGQSLLNEYSDKKKEVSEINEYGFDRDNVAELTQYKEILKEYYREKFPERVIGSIVMNCNPFTWGHRYLIEQALEQCDFLMIFVVQEDKSFFPFEDRLRLVDECVADIPDKEVIPSGRFIISTLTFEEYFNKSELQERTVDTALDVTVFAREIAPCLHITKRFAGEEPSDSVTRQYNEAMARILPEYGIDFIEIPRAEIGGRVISASYVRELLSKKRFDDIKPLVPLPTYEYLLDKYDSEKQAEHGVECEEEHSH